MNDAVPVRLVECVGDLLRDVDRLAHLQRPLGEASRQRFAFDVTPSR